MKVWVAYEDVPLLGGIEIIGVFSTYEKAHSVRKFLGEEYIYIVEMIVDSEYEFWVEEMER